MRIAVLGPAGTFSENALNKYLIDKNYSYDRVFYNSIPQTFFAVGKECEIGIIPVENTLDGYVQRSLDMLLEQEMQIIDEIIIPIKFSLISNVKEKSMIKKVFVQFKANGQCLKFLNELKNIELVTTQSNTESFNMFLEEKNDCCAIIPNHMYTQNGYFGIEDVTDSKNNFTRFFVIKRATGSLTYENGNIKASIYILPNDDRPGVLYLILEKFYKNKINLCSIISRPTKKNLGTYNFYIELSGTISEIDNIEKTLKEINQTYNLKVMGIYNI